MDNISISSSKLNTMRIKKQTKTLIAFWIGVIALAVLLTNNVGQLIQLNQLFKIDKITINVISILSLVLSFTYLKLMG